MAIPQTEKELDAAFLTAWQLKEKIKEKKSTSKVAKKSTVQSKKLAKQKDIQQKKAIRDNLVKVMDKVDKDIKDISKNLQMSSEEREIGLRTMVEITLDSLI